MTFFQFISYEATPEDEKQLGVATVKLYGKIKLRYKIIHTKDGQGWFPIPASYKLGKTDDGKDKYVAAFMLNDRDEEEELIAAVRSQVSKAMQNKPQQAVEAPIPSFEPFPEETNLPF